VDLAGARRERELAEIEAKASLPSEQLDELDAQALADVDEHAASGEGEPAESLFEPAESLFEPDTADGLTAAAPKLSPQLNRCVLAVER
jgi:hypothetical protein